MQDASDVDAHARIEVGDELDANLPQHGAAPLNGPALPYQSSPYTLSTPMVPAMRSATRSVSIADGFPPVRTLPTRPRRQPKLVVAADGRHANAWLNPAA